ncbi:MAG TPA: hypothetical protein PK033_09145 [Acetivibrio sp.]|nr:hypothetical protein [Acetivibrio sp.]
MSVKPIDFQVMIPKTSEISKIQKDEQNKGLAMEQQQTVVNQKKSEDNVNLVHYREEAQNAKINVEEEKSRIKMKISGKRTGLKGDMEQKEKKKRTKRQEQ